MVSEASPQYAHVLGTRWRLDPGDAMGLAELWTALARREGLEMSRNLIKQGRTRGAFITEELASRCYGLRDVKRLQVTWTQGGSAYLVVRAIGNHHAIVRRVVDECFWDERVQYHGIAGVELATAIRRPQRSEIERIVSKSLVVTKSNGPVTDLAVLRRRLHLPTGKLEVSVRLYERRGDPAGGQKLEVNTSGYGDPGVRPGFLEPRFSGSLRDVLFACHELLDRLCRDYGLQSVAMPLNHKGFPVTWERRNRSNEIREAGAAGPLHSTALIAPDPTDLVEPLGARQLIARPDQDESWMVTEVGVPIFLDDDDDEILLRRLASYVSHQEERYQRFLRENPWARRLRQGR